MSDAHTTLAEAQRLYKAGALEDARRLVAALIRREPDNGDAWYAAAAMATSREQRIQLLERALQADPFHERADQALAKLRGASAALAAPPSPARPPRAPIWMYGAIGLCVLILVGLLVYALTGGVSSTASVIPTQAALPSSAPALLAEPTHPPTATPSPTVIPTATATPADYQLTATSFRQMQQTADAGLRLTATAAAEQSGS